MDCAARRNLKSRYSTARMPQMSPHVRLALVIHNHQPIGNFDSVVERAYHDAYLPVVQKAWDGLNAQVSAAGKLGYVQPVGAGPAAATADSTVEYGVGAYLLAGSEVAKLLP